MLQRTFLRTVIFLFVLSAVAIPNQRAQGRPRDDFRGTAVVELMRKYGHPDQIVPFGRKDQDQDQAYHWRMKTTATFEAADQGERREDFFCDVTAIVGQNGRVKTFEARPADVGAGALASIEAFGPLCRKAFGSRPSRAPGEKLARMRL
ncbi:MULTISPECIES: hypothetical protein [Bradyrhizobium]|uniref:hypothetical protein n=1 Tax=Bradyrhizobium TaxID=374 RepID=UPI002304EECB|nr:MULTISPECIES: hypothetical protein [unclassified Bradyrhizobium]MDA9448815.1 hypothetical protein [Bradyrhizobium sp. CCBAU 21360]MDA9454120.1 hypothetical protein [Bradyrhizobium sp. CCBAU 21359]MDA9515130.1 hypothetical protein [Bradyrhizobium sp. CCBAU 11430]